MSEREESDQLPEEGPAGQVPDDAGGAGDSRDDADENAGASGGAGSDDDQSTGNPANAGEDS